jgi:hypothetical protein
MDNNRPSLDLKYFEDICPDKNGMSKCEVMNWIDVCEFSSSCDSSVYKV